MSIGFTTRHKFSLLPYLHIVKVTNDLNQKAKIDLESEWDWYLEIHFGWLIWHNFKD